MVVNAVNRIEVNNSFGSNSNILVVNQSTNNNDSLCLENRGINMMSNSAGLPYSSYNHTGVNSQMLNNISMINAPSMVNTCNYVRY